MTALKSDLKATLEGLRKDQANGRISIMIWIAIMAGLIIGAQALLPMSGGGPPAAP